MDMSMEIERRKGVVRGARATRAGWCGGLLVALWGAWLVGMVRGQGELVQCGSTEIPLWRIHLGGLLACPRSWTSAGGFGVLKR